MITLIVIGLTLPSHWTNNTPLYNPHGERHKDPLGITADLNIADEGSENGWQKWQVGYQRRFGGLVPDIVIAFRVYEEMLSLVNVNDWYIY